MKTVGATEAKTHLSELLKRVSKRRQFESLTGGCR
jgi:hypothetical protein